MLKNIVLILVAFIAFSTFAIDLNFQELKIESFNIEFKTSQEGTWTIHPILNIKYCYGKCIKNCLTFTASIPLEWNEECIVIERADSLDSNFINIEEETKYQTAILSPGGVITKKSNGSKIEVISENTETLRKIIKIEAEYEDHYKAAEEKDFIQCRFYRLKYYD